MMQQEICLGDARETVVHYNVGADYFAALGLEFAQGQLFISERNAENAQSVVVNESFVQKHQRNDVAVGTQSWRMANVQSS